MDDRGHQRRGSGNRSREAGHDRRANGEASRERILAAAAEIAGERGYHGATVSLVSERSGLPASSIYWHFQNKDELVAAVIEQSYQKLVQSFDTLPDLPVQATGEVMFRSAMAHLGDTLSAFPDFLRLGLMLILDRRPDEPSARASFVAVRADTADRIRNIYRLLFSDLGNDQIESLVSITVALADGMFIAQELDEVELHAGFELISTTVLGTADRLRAEATRATADP